MATTNGRTDDWTEARARISASKGTAADPLDVATLWTHNHDVTEQWMADYGRRTGKSRVEIIAERQANWRHDARAQVVGVFDGFRLSACPHDGGWRYTVVTAWGTSEGLCDTDVRDDARAIAYLSQVTSCL